MSDSDADNSAEEFDLALEQQAAARYVLRLYVAGITPRSTQAITNIRRVCEEHLKDRYELEVVDIYQRPELARSADVVAAPTLIKQLPPPLRRLVGNLADVERVCDTVAILDRGRIVSPAYGRMSAREVEKLRRLDTRRAMAAGAGR